ncbi:MAG: Asp-tRNA(Asn)/Glu-tRNA(Gln) amidotransferase subunit GatA [Firmicutes bacterium]|nr:Asp-tRNA(Asn)/Glu-tRNA(Gln) amidotransferase subunit GatA [Bacillota bacterium]
MIPLTMTDARKHFEAGQMTAVEWVQGCLERIQRNDSALNAVLALEPTITLEAARKADARRARGERGELLGLPFVIKDNLQMRGWPLSQGSRVSGQDRGAFDATAVGRLLDAGAVPLAKANMDEFAMGSSGEYSAFGPTRNPWDGSRVPGGSSSGSVVAVAAGYAPLALGTDTGGSVRLPASFCGVSALRPTYGVLSRSGLTAMASSLDQIGPVASSVEDLVAALGGMAGRDPLDSTSVDLPGAERLAHLRPAPLAGLKIGLPQEYFSEGLSEATRTILVTAMDRLASEGAELVEVSLPHTRFAIDTYYLLNTSEVSSNLSRFDGVRFGERKPHQELHAMISRTRDAGLGNETKRRILLGAFCLSKGYYEAFYLKALKVRALIAEDFRKAFEKVDILATPLSPATAFPFGERTRHPLEMYLADVFTVTQALASLPALALPAGFDKGLPVGLQLVGPALSDVRLLEVGAAFQSLTDHHLAHPALPTPA